MNENPLISIIIPVYNVENFLQDCLNSVKNQTYTNLEIILVNDGSTDKSGEICDDFSLQDSRFKVLHQKNSGQAVARNNALNIANGEFISFVDSDDIISVDYIQTLFDLTQKFNTKIAMAGYKEFKENSEISTFKNDDLNEKILSQKDIFLGSCVGNGYFVTGVCRILYHREIFSNLCFPEGEIHEDVAIWFELFDKFEKIAMANKIIYFYRKNANSTTQILNDKFFSIIKNTAKFTDKFEKKYPEYAKFAKYKMCLTMLITAEKILQPKNEKYKFKIKEFHKFIRENLDISFAFKQGNFGKKLILYYISPKLFEIVYKFYLKLKG